MDLVQFIYEHGHFYKSSYFKPILQLTHFLDLSLNSNIMTRNKEFKFKYVIDVILSYYTSYYTFC